MAKPNNKMSFMSALIKDHFNERTNPMDMEFSFIGETFVVEARNIVNFYIESNIDAEYLYV